MPLIRIDVPVSTTADQRRAISKGVHRALVETFTVPDNDLFHIITEHRPDTEIVHAPSYLGITYSSDLIIIQLIVSDTRSVEQKKRLYARIVELLAENPGLRREDIFINLVEVKKENWSFGNGEAQYA